MTNSQTSDIREVKGNVSLGEKMDKNDFETDRETYR